MLGLETLDPRLQIFAYLFLVSNKLQVTMDKNIDDITAKQWFVLASLEYFDQSPRLTDLAEALGYSHQNIRQIINKLEAKGYVRIEKDPADQRVLRIRVLDKAADWAAEHGEDNIQFVDRMFASTDPQLLLALRDQLDILYQNLMNF